MPSRLSRRSLLRAGAGGLGVTFAGCAADSSSPTPTTTRSQGTLALPDTGGCPNGAVDRLATETDLASRVADRYTDVYTGPLFLTHEHVYTPLDDGTRGPWEMREECLANYVDVLEDHEVARALVFAATHQLPALSGYGDRFAPFLNDFIFTTFVNERPIDEWASMAEDRLHNHDTIAGLGEFALFGLDTEGRPTETLPADPLRADHPALLDVYTVAADNDVPVMLHPFLQPPQLDEEHADDPLASTEVRALANAFEQRPETTFLLHGLQPVGEWIATLLEEHPNVYYDAGVAPHSWNPDSGIEAPIDFREHMTPEHVRVHAERLAHPRTSLFDRVPERVVLAFDMGQRWTLDARVLSAWVATYRSVLGYLPEDVARGIAIENAERLLEN